MSGHYTRRSRKIFARVLGISFVLFLKMESRRLKRERLRRPPSKRAQRMWALSRLRWEKAKASDRNVAVSVQGDSPGPSGISTTPRESNRDSETNEIARVRSPNPSGMSDGGSSGPGSCEGSSGDIITHISGSEFSPTPVKKRCVVNLGDRLFVGQISQIQSFIDQINNASKLCHTSLPRETCASWHEGFWKGRGY